MKDNVREELGEDVVEKQPLLEVPHDFADRANNDYEHDFERVQEAVKILIISGSSALCALTLYLVAILVCLIF